MRLLWLTIGSVATACAIAGILLPLVPTTPFLLVAAFAFARSSPALYERLVTHRRLGPVIEDWRAHGAIARGTKLLALAVMLAAVLASWAAGLGATLVLLQAGVLAIIAVFIVTRPDA